jgi:probable F420-dependent oxidoreductase
VRLDVRLTDPLQEVPAAARHYEQDGYGCLWVSETAHDPFLAIYAAAQATTTIELGTSVAIAFARNPMTVATTANDIHAASGGRMLLGLGPQIRPHIEDRFSMTWSHPAARMREFVLALRAIWRAWNEGSPLDFRGDFYRHTLMTPFFSPGPNEFGSPPVFLAGVGPKMTEVVGEVADGMICHALTSQTYLSEMTIPALQVGLERSGRQLNQLQIAGAFLVVTGFSDQERAIADREARRQIAFYASTRAYLPVLTHHGWQDLQSRLNVLARRGDWDQMGSLITDEMLDTFAIVADPGDIAARLLDRYGHLMTRCSLYLPYASSPDSWGHVVSAINKQPSSAGPQ